MTAFVRFIVGFYAMAIMANFMVIATNKLPKGKTPLLVVLDILANLLIFAWGCYLLIK